LLLGQGPDPVDFWSEDRGRVARHEDGFGVRRGERGAGRGRARLEKERGPLRGRVDDVLGSEGEVAAAVVDCADLGRVDVLVPGRVRGERRGGPGGFPESGRIWKKKN